MGNNFQESIVYIDGKFLKGEQARISVWDHALMYGDAVYDTARVYDGFIFRLDDHIERLFESAKAVQISCPLSKDELKQAVVETVKRNGLKNAQVRIILTRGVGPPGLDPSGCASPSLIISAVEVSPMLGRRPVKLLISTIRKKSPASVDPKIKSINYLENILAKIQARAAGFDDAIMLDHNGLVAEATGANIFLVKKKRLFTPPTVSCLAGITRQTIIELAGELGIEVVETALTPQDLYSSSEVFLTGTGIDGIVPVENIDGRKIGERCPGEVTLRLDEGYRQLVKTKYLTSL